ncbi:MAG: DUF3604 domain-containing protein [Roseobacter sp.]
MDVLGGAKQSAPRFVFPDGSDQAWLFVLILMAPVLDRTDPRDLLKWTRNDEDHTSGSVLAIPQNPNLLISVMFAPKGIKRPDLARFERQNVAMGQSRAFP